MCLKAKDGLHVCRVHVLLVIYNGNRTEWSPIRSVIIQVTMKWESDLLITSLITDRIGRHEVQQQFRLFLSIKVHENGNPLSTAVLLQRAQMTHNVHYTGMTRTVQLYRPIMPKSGLSITNQIQEFFYSFD